MDKETLIKMIEDFGIDNTAKKLNAGSRTVKSLMKDWGIKTSYLSAKDRLVREIGSEENLKRLLKSSSLTKLGEKFGVGRNTVKGLCDDWGIDS